MLLDFSRAIGTHVYYAGSDLRPPGYGKILGRERGGGNIILFKVRMVDSRTLYTAAGNFHINVDRLWFTVAERVEYLRSEMGKATTELLAEMRERIERTSGTE